MQEFNLMKVFNMFKKHKLLISIITVLAIAITGAVSYFALTPVYENSTQILINQDYSGTADISNQDIEADLQLVNTYSFIIKSPVILNNVIEKLNLNKTTEELHGNISVISASNSQVIEVSVRDENPETAANIANMTAAVFKTEVHKLMNINNVSILSPAILKKDPTPVAPTPILNMAVAAVLGLAIGVGIAFLRDYMDTTIKSEEDAEELLGLPMLATISPIPVNKSVKETQEVLPDKEGLIEHGQ